MAEIPLQHGTETLVNLDMALRFETLLKPFRGTAGEEFDVFWARYLAAASANGWDDTKPAANLPSLLDGAAFVLYSRLSTDDKKDLSKNKEVVIGCIFGVEHKSISIVFDTPVTWGRGSGELCSRSAKIGRIG